MSNQRQQIKIDLLELKNVECAKCKGIFFTEVLLIKLVPGIMVAQREDQRQPVTLLKCVNCGHIENSEKFLPTPTEPTNAKSFLTGANEIANELRHE